MLCVSRVFTSQKEKKAMKYQGIAFTGQGKSLEAAVSDAWRKANQWLEDRELHGVTFHFTQSESVDNEGPVANQSLNVSYVISITYEGSK